MITLEELKKDKEALEEKFRRYEEQQKKKETYELEYPDIEDVDYFYIGNSGGILRSYWTGDSFDKGRWEIGNGFPSFELAEKKEKQELLITRFNQFRDKCNGDWKPDFTNSYSKHYITYIDGVCSPHWTTGRDYFTKFGYFKSAEDCERAIELFGDDIKELF